MLYSVRFWLKVIGVVSCLSMASAAFGGKAKDYFADYKRPDSIPQPKDNKITDARVKLGHMLFFDPRLSSSQFISCATCHNPALGWEDGMAKGFGHGMKRLGRHTPTVLNLAWAPLLFWDGRSDSLEDQALGPIQAAGEMNMSLEDMNKRIQEIKGYKQHFAKAYPGEPVAPQTVAKAIATFERTLVSADAPFDRWIKGDEKAVSDAAKRGFVVFNEKGDCARCHASWRFTDDSFHNLGLKSKDNGRGDKLPLDSMKRAFKTPTLRNITERGPYMHDGSEGTLDDVVDFYNRGGDVKAPNVTLKKLNLSKKEKMDLVAFLRTLTSVDKPITVPMLPQ